jgi:quercetin dioxygenase-like cupin family protein
MLDRFTWTGGTVFAGKSARVVAAVDPSMNLLAAFTEPGAVFGFVLDGQNAVLRRNGMAICLAAGCYFVASPDTAELASPGGRILLIQQAGSNFPFLMGGPVEARGRLRYIDGCTDSLLIAPWRRGEACLNLLHIPAGVEQTMHTHPSDRIGVVVDGRGQCVTPDGVVELSPGLIWRIPADGPHRFRTPHGDAVRIVAWHPDSDTGPTDDDHPMVNRTLVGGVSAAEIDAIRTR